MRVFLYQLCTFAIYLWIYHKSAQEENVHDDVMPLWMPFAVICALPWVSIRQPLWYVVVMLLGTEDAIAREIRMDSLFTVAVLSLLCGSGWLTNSAFIAIGIWIIAFIAHRYWPNRWGDGDGDMLFLFIGSLTIDQLRQFMIITTSLILATLIPLLLLKKVDRHSPVPLIFYLSVGFIWTIGGF